MAEPDENDREYDHENRHGLLSCRRDIADILDEHVKEFPAAAKLKQIALPVLDRFIAQINRDQDREDASGARQPCDDG